MAGTPLLSVVMSVYNYANRLNNSIECILDQSFDDFEFIIVNDGSNDHSQQVLEKYAQNDSRIVLLNQPNCGLTRALIRGCESTTGRYIARQDVGDFSPPARFETQLDYLQAHPDCAAAFTYFRTVDENGNLICENHPNRQQISACLDISDGEIAAPSHHGSVMFNRHNYIKSGGYRPEFYFAQDLDLWLRMSETGDIHVIGEMLYHGLITTDGISGKYHRTQKQYHRIIVECARLRRRGIPEDELLEKASQIKPSTNAVSINAGESDTLYFMASCLIPGQPELAKSYLKKALRKNPANFKAWYKWLFKT